MSSMQVRAVLFDLDDTLVRVDMDSFIKEYFNVLAPRFAGRCDPKTFTRQLIASIEAMVNHVDGTKTNMDVFIEDFFPRIGAIPDECMAQIDEFYRTDFPKLRRFSQRDPMAAEVVRVARQRGLGTVLATNPLYPRVAILERMSWAGVDADLFDLITTYEIMHYCKPHPEYYLEICSLIGREPQECLMVGNDVEEDLAAGSIGMKTFLVQGAVRNRDNRGYAADHEGTLSDLLDLLSNGCI